MTRRTLLALAALLALGCDEAPAGCDDDPALDCCAAEPERPECQLSCVEDPTQERCRPSCADDPTQDACRAPCESDVEAPHCVPASRGPQAEVTVYRDSLGVPHAFAADDLDAMWASGYLQARDRLWQMDLARRRALGRQAEVLGEGRLNEDILLRTVEIARWAEIGLMRLRDERPELYALLVAWTAGVNARIEEVLSGEAPTPAGFTQHAYVPEPWRIVDGAAVGRLLLFGSSNQIENDLLATIIRDYRPELWESVPLLMPLEDAFIVPEEDRPARLRAPIPTGVAPTRPLPEHTRELPIDFAARVRAFRDTLGAASGDGSNNWAIAGAHTASGRPIIAGDPHQPLRTPSLFWAHHVHSETGGLDVAGFNFVGAPGVHLGHNARVAWTATLNYPDMMDLWDVRVTGGLASIGGEPVPLVSRTETVLVAGGDPVQVTIDRVPGHGVFLPDDLAPVPVVQTGRRILFGWTGFAATNDFASFHGIDVADSVDAFEAAIDGVEIGAFNWIAADTDDITYISSMWLPSRVATPTRLPWTLLDGDDTETLWTGEIVPRAMLPRSRATARGWIATANNDPFGNTADGDSTNDPYYFGVYFDPGTRAARIHGELERLAARGAITTDDVEALQTDTHSILADHMIPLLADAWARVPTDEALADYRGRDDLATLVTLLSETWDRRMTRDSAGPVVFTSLIYLFAKLAIEDEASLVFEPVLDAETVYMLKMPLLAAEGAWEGSEAIFQLGVPATVLAALDATAAWLTSRYGSVDPLGYTWADLHCTHFGAVGPVDGLDGGCVATDGGDGTVNVSSANFLRDGAPRDRHRSGGGAIYRMVATFGVDGVPEARVAFPPGNVEDPASPWFQSNRDDWIEGRYRPLPFRRAEVEADAQETFILPVR